MEISFIKERIQEFQNQCVYEIPNKDDINLLSAEIHTISSMVSECHTYYIQAKSLFKRAKAEKGSKNAKIKASDIVELDIFTLECQETYEMLKRRASLLVTLISAQKSLLNLEPKTRNYGIS